MKLFGFEIKRDVDENEDIPSFAPRETDDGALVISAGGTYGTYLDLEGTARSEAQIVSKYREMAIQPEIDLAISDIISEAIVKEDNKNIVEIDVDDLNYPENIKDRIREEFSNIIKLLDFNNYGYEIFQRWYIDGRIYYHAMIDVNDPSAGIKELRYIDPRTIRKVRAVKRIRKGQVFTNVVDSEFYMYNEKGFKGSSASGMDNQGLKISLDSVLMVTSGLVDADHKQVLGYLHKAIKPLNQLRIMEDATVIYRINRAPERRVFSIDVGNLPKMKAEQYVRDLMVRHRNRLIYDATTGNIRDDRKFMTMTEDFWFPRREAGGGTQVTTLPGGQNLGEMADVEYFQKALFRALNIPITRLDPQDGFTLGQSSQISRDELKFQKFITRLRTRFSNLFLKALEKQLVLKGVIQESEWANIESNIHFVYQVDNYFSELKRNEILTQKLNLLSTIDPYAGRYYSEQWIRKNVLGQSDEDIIQIDEQIHDEIYTSAERQALQTKVQMELNPQPQEGEGVDNSQAAQKNPGEGGGDGEPQVSD